MPRRSRFIPALALVCACHVGEDGNAFEAGEGGDEADASGEATGATTATSSTSGASADEHADDGSSGAVQYDVANDTDAAPPLAGSCRELESYGAVGGFPVYDDPDYATFVGPVLMMTSDDDNSNEPFALRVFDISGEPPQPNRAYLPPMYIHPSWTAQNFGGGVFGLTLDSYGHAYLAASAMFTTTTPGSIYRVDAATAAITTFVELPNLGPALGNLNYDCVSQTIYVSNFEDCRVYQVDMSGDIRSTFHHGTGEVTMGPPNDPGEPDGEFCPLGDRVWAVQSHAGRLYYAVWWEDYGRWAEDQQNEIWSIAYVDDSGVPDAATAQLDAEIPGLGGNTWSSPITDISFAPDGWMLATQRTMLGDTTDSAHKSNTVELQPNDDGTWEVLGTTYAVGEWPDSSAGGVDHDFHPGGYVWMTGDSLDYYTPDVVYGVQGTPVGGGDVTNSTLLDHDREIHWMDKGALGDVELPIPGDPLMPQG